MALPGLGAGRRRAPSPDRRRAAARRRSGGVQPDLPHCDRRGRGRTRGAKHFSNPAFMEALDVTFASFWIEAYDAGVDDVPKAWAALFERRHDRGVPAHPVRPRRHELPHRRTTLPSRSSGPAASSTPRRRMTGSAPTTRRSTICSLPPSPRSAARSSAKPARTWTTTSAQWSTSSTRGRSTRRETSPGSTSRRCGPCVASARSLSDIEKRWPARSAWRRVAC